MKSEDLKNALEWIHGKYALDKRYISSFGHLEDPWTQKVVRAKRRTMKHYATIIKAIADLEKISQDLAADKETGDSNGV